MADVQPSTSVRKGWYIEYHLKHRDSESGTETAFVYRWDADQGTFTRIQDWWTCYPTRREAQEEFDRQDFTTWCGRPVDIVEEK
jgi:hypothetical protein